MTITFPRNLPTVKLKCDECDYTVIGQEAATLGGQDTVMETAVPVWFAKYSTPLLRGADLRAMEAWLSSIKSPPQYFWARDTRARYPRAYQGGFGSMLRPNGTAFDGTCVLSSVGIDSVSLGLSSLPAGFILGEGDLLSFSWDGGRQAFHRIISPAASANTSGLLTVEVRPLLRSGYSSGVTVRLDKPVFKAKLVMNSDRRSRNDSGFCTFSFEARQVLTQ